jgi:hypothetical protein
MAAVHLLLVNRLDQIQLLKAGGYGEVSGDLIT